MISELAIIDPSAKIADGVTVGPGAVIGKDVEIGEGCWVGPHAVVEGPAIIGKNNRIFQFSSVGDAPQDLTYQGEPTKLVIGDNNIIREYAMISRGTVKGGGETRIGDNNFFMAYTHVGHDCIIGNHNVMVNYSALSGHTTLENFINIGAYAGVHQFCKVGSYAFVAKGTHVTKDVLPYVMIAGHDTSACGINTVGLKRGGFTSEQINLIRRAYRIIFRKGLTVIQAIAELEEITPECVKVQPLIDALNSSTRGIVR